MEDLFCCETQKNICYYYYYYYYYYWSIFIIIHNDMIIYIHSI